MPIATNTYYIGALVRLTATFTDSLGALVDPATVTAKVKAPDLTIETFVYGVDIELVRTALGVYRLDVVTDQSGEYCYRWESTGAGGAVSERHFDIDAGCFSE